MPKKKNNWHEVGQFCLGSWQRALLTIFVIFVLALTGAFAWMLTTILHGVVMPLLNVGLVIVVVVVIYRLALGKKASGGHR